MANETQRSDASNKTKVTLEGECDIVIARTFPVPARIVFDAWTKPEFVSKWWAPKALGVEIVECTATVKAGGTYRYVIRVRGEETMGFSGEYHEVTPYTRLVYSHVFEPMAFAGAAHITVTFTELQGVTHLVSRERYPSAEIRKSVLESGMEAGLFNTMDQLETLLTSLRSEVSAAT